MPFDLTDFEGLDVVTPDPTGEGGKAINDNFKGLATRLRDTMPSASDNFEDGIRKGSRWIVTESGAEYVCTDPGSENDADATWVQLAGGGNTFEGLSDTDTLAGKANQFLVVRADASGITYKAAAISDVSGLQTVLDGKAPTAHTHISADITDAASANVANKLIIRDGSGNFAANIITTPQLAGASTTAALKFNSAQSQQWADAFVFDVPDAAIPTAQRGFKYKVGGNTVFSIDADNSACWISGKGIDGSGNLRFVAGDGGSGNLYFHGEVASFFATYSDLYNVRIREAGATTSASNPADSYELSLQGVVWDGTQAIYQKCSWVLHGIPNSNRAQRLGLTMRDTSGNLSEYFSIRNGTGAANAQVGINTASPSSALEVVGTVTATAFAGSGASLTDIPASAVHDPTRIRLVGTLSGPGDLLLGPIDTSSRGAYYLHVLLTYFVTSGDTGVTGAYDSKALIVNPDDENSQLGDCNPEFIYIGDANPFPDDWSISYSFSGGETYIRIQAAESPDTVKFNAQIDVSTVYG